MTYPLTENYNKFYVAFCIFMILLLVARYFVGGTVYLWDAFGIAAVLALIKDRGITKRILTQSTESKLQHGLPSLILAAAEGNDELVTSILNSGVQPNITGPDGQTALMLAARNGHLNTAKLLIENGASPNVVTNAGNSAEDIAAKFGHTQILDFLKQHATASGKQAV